DSANNAIGARVDQTFAAASGPAELVTVFSETDTAVSYTGGVVRLSGGRCVTFSQGSVAVATCPGKCAIIRRGYGAPEAEAGARRSVLGRARAAADAWPLRRHRAAADGRRVAQFAS